MFIVLLIESHASERPASARLRNRFLRETLFASRQNQNAVGNCKNVFLDNQGFPDQSDNYNHLLHSIDGGLVLQKLRHPMPDLNGPIDPSFDHPFIQEEHDAIMRKKVDLSHLDLDLQNQVYDLIREFWPVFDERGVFVPVKNYECVMDTGTARPIAVKKIFYGERETVIM